MFHVINFAMYAGVSLWLVLIVHDDGKLDSENTICHGEAAYDKLTVNKIFVIFWVTTSIIIDVWLIIVGTITLWILNNRINFRKEKC